MAAKFIPDGHHTICPYLTVTDADAQLEFLKRAFGAKEAGVMRRPDGAIAHAEVIIGDSHVMLGQASGEWKPMPCMIHMYVPDCDAVYRAALAAGATSVREPANQFYGDRSGGVRDMNGNMWWMSTHVEDVSKEEMERRAKEYMEKSPA